MNKEKILEKLEEVKENVSICCAVTMEPEDVLELLDEIEQYIKES